MPPSRTRGWWRSYFHDHPAYGTKAPESKDTSDKAKVWCMLCFEARIACENTLDESMVIGGTREVVRSRSAIEDMIWAHGQSDVARGWLVSRSTTLICHLRDCELQPKSVRDRAVLDTTESASPVRSRPTTNRSQVPSVPWPITTEASGSRPITSRPPFHFASALSSYDYYILE